MMYISDKLYTHKNPDAYLSDMFGVPPSYASAPSPSHRTKSGVLLFLMIFFTKRAVFS